MLFDHIIFLANPTLMHWNFVLIFPKLKKIEVVDSLPGYYDPKVLTAAWYWMVHYCSCNEIPFTVDGWRLLHSRKSSMNQKDTCWRLHSKGWTHLFQCRVHQYILIESVSKLMVQVGPSLLCSLTWTLYHLYMIVLQWSTVRSSWTSIIVNVVRNMELLVEFYQIPSLSFLSRP